MPLTKKGSLTCPASGTTAVTGLGFAPKAVIFFGTDQVATGYAAEERGFLGFAVSSSLRRVISWASNDNVNPAVVGRKQATNRCIETINGARTLQSSGDYAADADGFTITWSTFHDGQIVHYLALGGDDITDVALGSEVTNTSATGDRDTTSLGFQPDLVLMASIGNTSGAATNVANQTTFIGASDGTNHAAFTASEATTSPTSVQQQLVQTQAIVIPATPGGVNFHEGTMSMLSNGFRISYTTSGAVRGFYYLAIKGGKMKVGAETQKTSTGTKATTGVGFEPTALFAFGGDAAANASIDLTQKAYVLGAASAAGVEGAVWTSSTDNIATSDTNAATVTDKILRSATAPSTTDAEADLASFDADGFTLNWTTADSTARQFSYVAIGPAITLLTGTSASTSTSTGNLDVAHPLTGTSDGTSTTTGSAIAAWTLTGTSAGTSTSTGSVDVAHPIDGTSAGTSTTTGSVDVAHPLTGTSAGTSTSTGEILITRGLDGTSASTSTTTGSVDVAHSLEGTSAGTSTTTGDAIAAWSLVGTSAATSTTTGALTASLVLTGTSASTSTSTGDLGLALPLTGTSAGTSTSSGSIIAAWTLVGTSAGTSTTTGDTAVLHPLDGTSASTSTTTGSIDSLRALDGTSAGTSTTTGSLIAAWTLVGTSAGTSTTTGAATVVWALDGTSIATSATSGNMDGFAQLDGTSAGTSASTGSISVVFAPSGASAGTSTTTGDVEVQHPLTGTSAGTSTTNGSLDVVHPLTGTSIATSTSTGDLRVQLGLDATSASTSTTSGDALVTRGLTGTSASVGTTTGSINAAYVRSVVDSAGPATFTDSFASPTVDSFWTTLGSPAQTGGRLGLVADNSGSFYYSVPTLTVGANVMIELIDPTAEPYGWLAYFALATPAYADFLGVEIWTDLDGDAHIQARTNTETIWAETGYDSIEHRYLRFRERGGVEYVETSATGATWVTRGSVAAPWIGDARVEIAAYRWDGANADALIEWDNFRLETPDVLNAQMAVTKGMADVASANDAATSHRVNYRSAADQAAATDAAARTIVLSFLFDTDRALGSDELDGVLPTIFNLGDVALASDTSEHLSDFTRSPADLASASDSLSRIGVHPRFVTDVAAALDIAQYGSNAPGLTYPLRARLGTNTSHVIYDKPSKVTFETRRSKVTVGES